MTRIESPLSRRRVCSTNDQNYNLKCTNQISILTYWHTRTSAQLRQRTRKKAGLPRLANRCETMSPTKPKYEWIPQARKPNKKTQRVNAPQTIHSPRQPIVGRQPWEKSDRVRMFWKRCYRIATALSRASRARLKLPDGGLCKPKHVGATIIILNDFNSLTIL